MGGVGGRERKCVSTLTPDELASTRVEIRERVDTASEMCREPETGDGRRATGDGRRATGDGRRATGDGGRKPAIGAPAKHHGGGHV